MLALNLFILQVSNFPFCYTLDESGGGKAMLIGGGGGAMRVENKGSLVKPHLSSQ